MTEEIIIDGVNVVGCDFYNNCRCSAQEHYAEGEFLWAEKCKECPNCYYKQLKRAEIEIEKLKGVDGSVHPDSAYYKITRLEQENKALNFKINQLKANSLYNDLTGIEISAKVVELEQKYEQLRKALEEIRGNLVKLKTNDEDDFTYEYSKIEDRINECIGD